MQVAKGLVQLAEKGVFTGVEVRKLIEKYVQPMIDVNIDQLVLGCTHYPLFIEEIKKLTGDSIQIVDSGEAVARRTKDVLMQNKLLNTQINDQKIAIFTSKKQKSLDLIASELFEVDKIEPFVEINFL